MTPKGDRGPWLAVAAVSSLGATLLLVLGGTNPTSSDSGQPDARSTDQSETPTTIPPTDPDCVVAWIDDEPLTVATVESYRAKVIPAPDFPRAARWAIDVQLTARDEGLAPDASAHEKRAAYSRWLERRAGTMTSDALREERAELHGRYALRPGPCAPLVITSCRTCRALDSTPTPSLAEAPDMVMEYVDGRDLKVGEGEDPSWRLASLHQRSVALIVDRAEISFARKAATTNAMRAIVESCQCSERAKDQARRHQPTSFLV